MAATPGDAEVVRVSQKGQATIPKRLREKFGIETPGEVFVYESDGRIVIEPVPTMEELHGIHADDTDDVMDRVRQWRSEEREEEADELASLIERHGE